MEDTFFILAPLEIYSQYLGFTAEEWELPIWWMIFSLLVYVVFFVALFGLAFSKRIAPSNVWRFYLPILISTDVFEFFSIIGDFNMSVLRNQIIIMIWLSVIFFTWYIVYKYQKVMRYFS
ncbi:hypothetical protein [Microbulbifer sp. VAAF005]|uniref:hypothetical protein n=1 Tax=Microbulbifer sp. VAAF005 TaxID=3034230 RepID=UPI0024AE0679|nr:hypothetical protein [Microbulbifer sp. VAAF005]WHI47188.1 hypothetical protein P0078_02095 [Microbulbifer sp. VAAF005]